jgi:hypothetical protein
LPLTLEYFALQTFLQVSLLTTQLSMITKEGLQGAGCLEEEAKVASFLLFGAFPLELFPLQPLQNHRDGDIETSGIGVFCSFHQAVPGGLPVIVPVGHI